MTILKFLRYVGIITWAVLTFDALCFIAWALSGQTPIDGFYFGAITANILNFII